ncbi:MAG: ribosome maturation factor RimM [Proteobacteria bacterium]|nr:ribosome maturation factor RimM [Pseudomonadota bacterium]
MDQDELVRVGTLGAAHGLRGSLRLVSDLEDPGIIAPGLEICLDVRGKIRWVEVLTAAPHRKGLLVSLKGVDTREQAMELTGAPVSIPRSRFPEPGEGTYYWFDILGLSVFTSAGQGLGTIRAIIPTGANDVYEVMDEAGNETLVPALEWVIESVDLSAGKMVVTLPEGL